MPPTKMVRYCCISIHAPRTGSDAEMEREAEKEDISIHATTLSPEILDSHKTISIHAPRTGSDFQRAFNRV